MISLFLGVTAINVLCLSLAVFTGYTHSQYHVLIGVVAAIVCCGVHCIVITYFMATSKWVQHAVNVKHLDAALAAPTRSFRRQAVPAALAAMTIVFITAIFGAARENYGTPRIYHHSLAIASLVINL